ncbi:hypothetical protein CXR26_15550 [Brevibacterium aurantiacum]|nr:hypothetical protein CXR26_15550 [Brevibacterium aurantiacum]
MTEVVAERLDEANDCAEKLQAVDDRNVVWSYRILPRSEVLGVEGGCMWATSRTWMLFTVSLTDSAERSRIPCPTGQYVGA